MGWQTVFLALLLPLAMPVAMALPADAGDLSTDPLPEPSPDLPLGDLAPEGRIQEFLTDITGEGAAPGGGNLPPADGDAPLADPGVGLAGLAAGLAASGFIGMGMRRVHRDNVLEHPTREGIYRWVCENGSANLRGICDALELSPTNASWHLKKLIRSGILGETQVNGSRIFYPRADGLQARRRAEQQALLSNENARDLYAWIQDHPGVHQRELARALDLNHGTVRWHLDRLSNHDLIESEQVGRTVQYRVISQEGPRGAQAAPQHS